MDQPVIARNPDVMGGTPVFLGTRVPIQTLLDYLEAGDTIDDFLEGFPSVTRAQAVALQMRGNPRASTPAPVSPQADSPRRHEELSLRAFVVNLFAD
jgi:uncharacterized protein (DUF433 family)